MYRHWPKRERIMVVGGWYADQQALTINPADRIHLKLQPIIYRNEVTRLCTLYHRSIDRVATKGATSAYIWQVITGKD